MVLAAQQACLEWFQKCKKDVIKGSALCLVCEKSGLGNPPELFITNTSKSIDVFIKSKVDYRMCELNKFINKMKCLVIDQQREVEQAIGHQGKYTLCSKYQFLKISEDRWFAMTPEVQSKQMAKVHHYVVIPDTIHVVPWVMSWR